METLTEKCWNQTVEIRVATGDVEQHHCSEKLLSATTVGGTAFMVTARISALRSSIQLVLIMTYRDTVIVMETESMSQLGILVMMILKLFWVSRSLMMLVSMMLYMLGMEVCSILELECRWKWDVWEVETWHALQISSPSASDFIHTHTHTHYTHTTHTLHTLHTHTTRTIHTHMHTQRHFTTLKKWGEVPIGLGNGCVHASKHSQLVWNDQSCCLFWCSPDHPHMATMLEYVSVVVWSKGKWLWCVLWVWCIVQRWEWVWSVVARE